MIKDTHYLKKKDIVFIRELDRTRIKFQLDSTGNMEKMKGHNFPIDSISGTASVRIYNNDAATTYIFDSRDLDRVDVNPPKPKIFEFDTKHLEVP